MSGGIDQPRDGLIESHRRMLQESGLGAEIVSQRGYRTILLKRELIDLGFKPYQARVPGLLVPIHGAEGGIVSYQFRPDTPRKTKAGKIIKYESLVGSCSRLDVPPCVQPKLGDPNVPLGMTEGSRKVDCLTEHGLNSLGLLGVYGFRGKNEQGGSTVLGDFEQVALKGRKIFIIFDSDAEINQDVRKAEGRLFGFLVSRGANPQIARIPSPDGRKVESTTT